jgi:NADPH-dependent 2,4-dienoyl-CoA reductase/sulfur reductase-like enzyme
MPSTDLLVIGAGPAGMAAAATAAAASIAVTVLDEQPAAGGQIYRAIEAASGPRGAILGADYLHGLDLVGALSLPSVTHESGATVWRVDADGTVAYSRGGGAQLIRARRIVLATGALERPVAVPGWTLPGVMTVGAAQILLKQSGVVPRGAVIAGSGPLLYLAAQQLIRAGQPPAALVETQTYGDLCRALGHFPGALRRWRYLAKGAAMLADIRRAGVPRFRGARRIRIEGESAARGIAFESGGRTHRIDCETPLLHQGVVPNTQITRSLGLEHVWDESQRCFRPKLDEWGATGLGQVYVAGDGAGIGGAKAAEHAGRLCALHAAAELGAISTQDRDRRAAALRKALRAERAIRPFLDAAYAPSPEILRPAGDDTIVCRCEEVTAGDIRRYAKIGCSGPNQTKAFGRCGMGPCQGRYCGLTVTELLAESNGTSQDSVGYYRIRTPLKPITLGELADLGAEPREKSAEPAN